MIRRGSFINQQRGSMPWLLVIFILCLVGMGAYFAFGPQLQPHTTLTLGDGEFNAQVANTESAREQGLSGTSTLASDQAMLFIFTGDGKWTMWMKDMNYPIDIVWLDSSKKVIYIVKDAQPNSYPYVQYTPKQDARYVVELPAGTVDNKSIDIGTVASFDENNIQGLRL